MSMIRNRNGFWMSPKFTFSADDGGAPAGDGGVGGMGGSTSAPAGDNVPGGEGNDAGSPDNGAGDGHTGDASSKTDSTDPEALNAEIARLKSEMAKQKNALDNATKEAGNLRKELRSKMTQEQIDAETKKEAEEAAAKELDDLRKEVAKGKTVKSVMGKLGLDEDAAGSIADALYGAEDVDNVLLLIQKAWQAKEKALRLEFGKVTAPGAGADSNSPEAQAIRRAAEIGKTRNAQSEQAQKALGAYMR
jgi:hypothetical protein